MKEIKVVSENVSEQISLEIDKQLKAEMQKADDILNPELFERKIESVSTFGGKKRSKNQKETLQPDKPLEFTKNDTHSFSEWLKLTKAKPIERSEEILKDDTSSETSAKLEASIQDEKERKFEFIDKFIQERPKITPSNTENKTQKEEPKKLSPTFQQTPESLMTETLAKVYLQQKNYKKAIQAYKILILKNPEKSGFFADQIRAIEKLINSEQS